MCDLYFIICLAYVRSTCTAHLIVLDLFTLIISDTEREVDVSWRKLHNDELHLLYFSPHIVRVIKSRRMR
jgi:hypothetical protein